jgi:hypothetical protein
MNLKCICSFALFTFWMNGAIVFVIHRHVLLSALQFVLIVHNFASLRFAWTNDGAL